MILAEVCLITNDVRRLSAFYRMILETSSDCDSDVHQAIRTEGAQLTLYNDGSAGAEGCRRLAIAFTVDDVDRQYGRLTKLGISIDEPPTTRPWGARNMLLSDPDGNRIAFRTLIQA